MVTVGRTSDFTRFIQLQIHKFHLTKTQSQAVPLQLHVKSQTVSFFGFPLKHLNEFIIAHLRATRATCYILCIGYASKSNNQLQMYNFTTHTALFSSFSPPS
jgi:hypothetical protein